MYSSVQGETDDPEPEFGEEDRTQRVAAQGRQDGRGHGEQGAGGPDDRTGGIRGHTRGVWAVMLAADERRMDSIIIWMISMIIWMITIVIVYFHQTPV